MDDISDGMITKDKKIINAFNDQYKCSPHGVTYKNHPFFRNYSEGAVTDYDYKWKKTTIKKFVTQFFKPCLKDKALKIIEDDNLQHVSPKTKQGTLIIEFLGVNDFLFLFGESNFPKLTFSGIKPAINEQIKSIEKLIRKGYDHFILFNMPNLSLTPRFHDNRNVVFFYEWCEMFNKTLKIAVKKLK